MGSLHSPLMKLAGMGAVVDSRSALHTHRWHLRRYLPTWGFALLTYWRGPPFLGGGNQQLCLWAQALAHSDEPFVNALKSPSTGSPIQACGFSTTSPLYEVLAGTAGSAGEGNVPKPSAIGSAKTSICTGGEEGSDRRRAGTEQGEDGRRRTGGGGGEQADLVWAVLAV